MRLNALKNLNPSVEITAEIVNLVNRRIKLLTRIQNTHWGAGLPAPGDAMLIINMESTSVAKSAAVMDWAKGLVAMGPDLDFGVDSLGAVYIGGWDEKIETSSFKRVEWTGRTVLQTMHMFVDGGLGVNFTMPVRLYIAMK